MGGRHGRGFEFVLSVFLFPGNSKRKKRYKGVRFDREGMDGWMEEKRERRVDEWGEGLI